MSTNCTFLSLTTIRPFLPAPFTKSSYLRCSNCPEETTCQTQRWCNFLFHLYSKTKLLSVYPFPADLRRALEVHSAQPSADCWPRRTMFFRAQPCLGGSPLTFGPEWDLDMLIHPNSCRLRRQAAAAASRSAPLSSFRPPLRLCFLSFLIVYNLPKNCAMVELFFVFFFVWSIKAISRSIVFYLQGFLSSSLLYLEPDTSKYSCPLVACSLIPPLWRD